MEGKSNSSLNDSNDNSEFNLKEEMKKEEEKEKAGITSKSENNIEDSNGIEESELIINKNSFAEMISTEMVNKIITLSMIFSENKDREKKIPNFCSSFVMKFFNFQLEEEIFTYDNNDYQLNINNIQENKKSEYIPMPTTSKLDNFTSGMIKIQKIEWNENEGSSLEAFQIGKAERSKENTRRGTSRLPSTSKSKIKSLLLEIKEKSKFENNEKYPNTSNAFNLTEENNENLNYNISNSILINKTKDNKKRNNTSSSLSVSKINKLSSKMEMKLIFHKKDSSNKSIIDSNKSIKRVSKKFDFKMDFFKIKEEEKTNANEDVFINEIREMKFKEIRQKEEENAKLKIRQDEKRRKNELENQMKAYEFDGANKGIGYDGQVFNIKRLGVVDKNDFPVIKSEHSVVKTMVDNEKDGQKEKRKRKVEVKNEKENENFKTAKSISFKLRQSRVSLMKTNQKFQNLGSVNVVDILGGENYE